MVLGGGGLGARLGAGGGLKGLLGGSEYGDLYERRVID